MLLTKWMVISLSTFVEVRIFFNWTQVTHGITGIFVLSIGLFLSFAALILNHWDF